MEYNAGSFKDIAESRIGRDMWIFLNERKNIEKMKLSVRLGHPAVEGIAIEFASTFSEYLDPENGSKVDRIKQCAGHMIRQIMESEGYEKRGEGVCRTTRVFNKGGKYRMGYITDFETWTHEAIGDDLRLAAHLSSTINIYRTSDTLDNQKQRDFFRITTNNAKIKGEHILIESSTSDSILLLASVNAINAYQEFLDRKYGRDGLGVEEIEAFERAVEKD